MIPLPNLANQIGWTIGEIGRQPWIVYGLMRTAGAATFTAFPTAYAVMFSGFYTPLMLLLFALILRGVAFEFRGKGESDAWRRTWDACLVFGSFVPALLLGVAFANIFAGISLDANGIFQGNLLTFLNPYGLIGGAPWFLPVVIAHQVWVYVRFRGPITAKTLEEGPAC